MVTKKLVLANRPLCARPSTRPRARWCARRVGTRGASAPRPERRPRGLAALGRATSPGCGWASPPRLDLQQSAGGRHHRHV